MFSANTLKKTKKKNERERFGLNVDAFNSRKKGHVHFAFKFILTGYDCFDKLIGFLSNEREGRKIFVQAIKWFIQDSFLL